MKILRKDNVLLEILEKDKFHVVNCLETSSLFKKTKENSDKVLRIHRKKILLNGLGYKCQIIAKKLIFKLNLSHSLEIDIPSYISKVTQKKKFFVFESYDKIMLGTFLERIYNLRPSDVYKFKGFYLESKSKVMKEVNKKNKKG